jgi:hypothetical protein
MVAQRPMKSFCRTWRRPIVWRNGSPAIHTTPKTLCRMQRCAHVAASRVFGAVNACAWSLTIVRNTANGWLMNNRPKAVVYTDDLSVTEQQELEHEGPQGTRVETPEEIALFKANAEGSARHGIAAGAVSRSYCFEGNESIELSRYRRDHQCSDRHSDVPSVPGQATSDRSFGRRKVKL